MSAMTGSVSAVEPSIFQKVYGPFDFTQGSYAVAVAELAEVQGSYAVAVAELVEVQGSYAVAVAELVEVQGSYFTLERNFFQVSWI